MSLFVEAASFSISIAAVNAWFSFWTFELLFKFFLLYLYFLQFYHLSFIHTVVEYDSGNINSYLHDNGYLMEILRITYS